MTKFCSYIWYNIWWIKRKNNTEHTDAHHWFTLVNCVQSLMWLLTVEFPQGVGLTLCPHLDSKTIICALLEIPGSWCSAISCLRCWFDTNAQKSWHKCTYARTLTCVLSKEDLLTPLWKGGGFFVFFTFQKQRCVRKRFVKREKEGDSLCVCLVCLCKGNLWPHFGWWLWAKQERQRPFSLPWVCEVGERMSQTTTLISCNWIAVTFVPKTSTMVTHHQWIAQNNQISESGL